MNNPETLTTLVTRDMRSVVIMSDTKYSLNINHGISTLRRCEGNSVVLTGTFSDYDTFEMGNNVCLP